MVNVDTNTLCQERTDIILLKKHSDSTKMLSEPDIINILDALMTTQLLSLVDVFVNRQSEYLWVQTVFLFFLYSYQANFIQGLLKKNEKNLARSFIFTFRYADHVLSLNTSTFGDFVELEIKDNTDTDRSASYIDLHLEIDSQGRLRTKHYDNRDYFNFPIVSFPFLCNNIPAYGVYISQLIRYSRACGSYQDFLS